MILRYFGANLSTNLVQFSSLGALTLFAGAGELAFVRAEIAYFLMLTAICQLGFPTSLVMAWKEVVYKREILWLGAVCVGACCVMVSLVTADHQNQLPILIAAFLFSSVLALSGVFQSESKHNLLLITQNFPRIMLYLSALFFLLNGQLGQVWILMIVGMVVFLVTISREIHSWYISLPATDTPPGALFLKDMVLVGKASVAPALLTVSAALIQNFEFLLMPESASPADQGVFARLSLVYAGVVATLFFLQNRAASLFAEGLLSLKLALAYSVAVIGSASSLLLAFFLISSIFPGLAHFFRIDDYNYVFVLVAVKSIVWASYAVSGILMFHLGFGRISVLIALASIGLGLILNWSRVDYELENILAINITFMALTSVISNLLVFRKLGLLNG